MGEHVFGFGDYILTPKAETCVFNCFLVCDRYGLFEVL